jgi:hypothetical protein
LYKISNSYNLKISIDKTKAVAFMGEQPIRPKLVLENKVTGEVKAKVVPVHYALKVYGGVDV